MAGQACVQKESSGLGKDVIRLATNSDGHHGRQVPTRRRARPDAACALPERRALLVPTPWHGSPANPSTSFSPARASHQAPHIVDRQPREPPWIEPDDVRAKPSLLVSQSKRGPPRPPCAMLLAEPSLPRP
jgi:hypothetical protein